MSRHAFTPRERCARCHMQPDLCLCASMPRLATRTRVVLVLHRSEDRKSTNTGHLAAACLDNSALLVRGRVDRRDAAITWPEDTTPLLLFPHEDAVPLDPALGRGRPITLIVPDGTWRQAGRVRKRVPELAAIPAVRVPVDAPSRYLLRRSPHPGGLATLEAVARALGILEEAEGGRVRAELERIFRAMVDRLLWSRGLLPSDEVSGGIPAGARQHAPRRAIGDPGSAKNEVGRSGS